jgi:FkbM family methyltransferase
MKTYSIEDVVRALYLAVLGREPDQLGFHSYVSLLVDRPERIYEVCTTFHRSAEHSERMLGGASIRDHSQYGEFRIILKHFVNIGARHRLIVDVGANGRERSNSFDLLKLFGWRGVLVEANPAQWPLIEKEFEGLDYSLVRCAVSESEGIFPFFLGINSDVSSLGRDNAAAWGEIQGEIAVTVRRLGSILDEHAIPRDFDILSLDIEGFDVVVLNDLISTSDYRPGLIIIETSMNFAHNSLEDIPVCEQVRKDYHLAYQTAPNMILARS